MIAIELFNALFISGLVLLGILIGWFLRGITK